VARAMRRALLLAKSAIQDIPTDHCPTEHEGRLVNAWVAFAADAVAAILVNREAR